MFSQGELKQQLIQEIEKDNYSKILHFSELIDRVDFADILNNFDINKQLKCLNIFSVHDSAEIFYYLNPKVQEKIIALAEEKFLKSVFSQYTKYEILHLSENYNVLTQNKLLSFLVNAEVSIALKQSLNKKKIKAQDLINENILVLHYEEDVKTALKKIKNYANENNEYTTFFIVDDNHKLIGEIDLTVLFFSKTNLAIKKIMNENPISIEENMSQKEVAEYFRKYDYSHLPVVDDQNKFIGIISYDEVIEIIEDVETENIQKLASVTPFQKPYLNVSIFKMTKFRIKWLAFLMISATFSQLAISSFTDWINSTNIILNSALISLIAVLPVISGTAGNAGSQSSTIIIRALAIKEITTKDYWKIMRIEVLTALCVGILLAFINLIRMFLFYWIVNNHFHAFQNTFLSIDQWKIIFCTFFALITAVFLAKSVGASLPIIAKKIKVDPAVMAAPLLTTLTDAVVTTIFFLLGIFVFWSLSGWT